MINHFFNENFREIRLTIDKHIIEDIGEKAGIQEICKDADIEFEGCVEDFISSVEGFCQWYTKYIGSTIMCPPSKDNQCKRCNKWCNQCNYTKKEKEGCDKSFRCINCKNCKYRTCVQKRKDVLAVANHVKDMSFYARDKEKYTIVGQDKKGLKQELPFFAIIIYVVCKFDNNKTQEWANVGEDISSNSRPYIIDLWKEISKFDPRFDPNASVYDRTNSEYEDYVGRILYHLPLSSSLRNKIQDAIYKSSSWKLLGTKSFWDILGYILSSLKDTKANEELNNILKSCFYANGYSGLSAKVSARKVQTVIEEFDIDEYEQKIAERRNSSDYSMTRTSGTFALGISFPEDEDEDSSIVLLTTVQQAVNEGGFYIKEGGSGTLGDYNTSYVRINNSTNAQIKEYSLVNKNYNIKPLPCEDVVFFYRYDDNLYIQTRIIIPAKSYFIAVRNGSTTIFENWCSKNDNKFDKYDVDETTDLFGKEWTVYYIKNINGQYYENKQENIDIINESTSIIKTGGITKNSSRDTYFINALPCFEVPEIYDINNVKIYMNLNGKVYDNYNTYIVGRKIIIDIEEMPIESNDVAYVDICFECDSKTKFPFDFKICGQSIVIDNDCIYKYDNKGAISEEEKSFYHGNFVGTKYRSENVTGNYPISKNEFELIPNNLYFTNLLAACCYDSSTAEITHDKFRKCVAYAATRSGIDIQRDKFISNVKHVMERAGILNINDRKCQAIVPSFMRVPFSVYLTQGTQLMMLCGCYTRAFIADLREFCKDHDIKMYVINKNYRSDEEALLPPIILLGHNFKPNAFGEKYKHKFDVLNDYDFALSLINIMPEYNDIKALFSFVHDDTTQFLSALDSPKTNLFPRMISISDNHQKIWYIEKQGHLFARVEKGAYSWASIYCYHEIGLTMVILNRDNSILIPSSLMLPNYVQRALYLMNLGLPQKKKVFICGSKDNKYYTLMDEYRLSSMERCVSFASKLSGMKDESSTLVRNHFEDKGNKQYHMEFWQEKFNGKKRTKKLLVLFQDEKDENRTGPKVIGKIDLNKPNMKFPITDMALESTSKEKRRGVVIAIAYDHKVYFSTDGSFRRIESDSISETLSFLITKNNWQYNKDLDSISYSKDMGESFEVAYRLTKESIEKPDENNYNIETIEIA